jgi:uncharacterized delta-60 repeat protein
VSRLVHFARPRFLLLVLLLTGAAALPAAAQAAPGDLDPTFGDGGSERFFQSEETTALRGVATQADDKIVLVGQDSLTKSLLVVRLLANGGFDPSFGSGGVATTPAPGGIGSAGAVAIQTDGKIVVVGAAKGALNVDFFVARYGADGTPDAGFGGGDGIAIVPIGAGEDEARAVAIGAGGRILVVGEAQPTAGSVEVGVAVLDPTGKPDPSFSGDGVTTLVTAAKSDRGETIAEQAGGGILVGDANGAGAGQGFTVFRLLPNGTPDPGFGTGGSVTTPITGSSSAGGRIRDLAVLPDDRIVAAGYGFDEVGGTSDAKFAAVRYLPEGKLDPTFGGGSGIFTRQVGVGEDDAGVVATAPGGKLFLAGSWQVAESNSAPAVMRLDAAGALDPTFGAGGIVTRPVLAPFGDFLEDAALDTRERLVVLSRPYLGGGNTSVEVTRFLGDIPPESTAGPSSQGPAKTANRPPATRIDPIPRVRSAPKLKQFSGTASDPDGDVLSKVQVALVRKPSSRSKAHGSAKQRPACLGLKSADGRFKSVRVPKGKPCPQLWLDAVGTTKWRFPLKATLPPGRYILFARAVDSRGLPDARFSRAAGNRVTFKLTSH